MTEAQEKVAAKLSRAEELAAKIAAKEEQIAKLKTKKRAIEAKERARVSKETRATETRRKILVGAMILEMAEKDGTLPQLQAQLDSFLKRDDDRALFSLPPLHTKRAKTE